MISFAVCEDEDYFASKLETMLRQYAKRINSSLSIHRFPDGEALMQSRQPFDVILMDIRLSGEDGISVMRRLRETGNSSQLLFITAYPEYALEAFSLDTVHYLMKPVDEANLFPALDRAVKRIASGAEKVFVLSKGNSLTKIRMNEILYCESLDHQIILHSLTGNLQFSGAFDTVQKQLDGRFFRCHRSFLVNMDYVTGTDADSALRQAAPSFLYFLTIPCFLFSFIIRFSMQLDSLALEASLNALNPRLHAALFFLLLTASAVFVLLLEAFRQIARLSEKEKQTAVLERQIAGQRLYLREARKRNAQC